MVIPMTQTSNISTLPDQRMCLQVDIHGEKNIFLTHQLSSYPARLLKKPIMSLGHLRYEIMKNIDLLINGF